MFAKAGNSYLTKIAHDNSALDNVATLRIAKLLGQFGSIISDSAVKYEPSILAKYLIDVAQCFNKFYNENKILGDNLSVQNARLDVVLATQKVLKRGLQLLGIQAPEQM